ncbi:MAG: class I SAM-dependent methyltransferase [Candidatus Doudnabacteria bacterium]|nr:class I SAM-dependent methyltransferase [Candidatus Doudnabacteria bacterium]
MARKRSRDPMSELVSDFIDFVNSVKQTTKLEQDGRIRLNATAWLETGLREAWSDLASEWKGALDLTGTALNFQALVTALDVDTTLPRETILCLGSGPGLYEIGLASMFLDSPKGQRIELLCLDSAFGMSQENKQLAEQVGLPNLRVVTADARQLPLADGSIEQVICVDSLQWVRQWQEVVTEVARVLRPRGMRRFYCTVHPKPMAVWVEGKQYPLNQLTPEELKTYLVERGFVLESSEPVDGGTGSGRGHTGRLLVAKLR